MSAEVSASYPGRSRSLLQEEPPLPEGDGKGAQKSAEGIVTAAPRCEGPKREEKTATVMSMEQGGFRPAQSAHQAVQTARRHVEAGHRWVVNHDILMARVARRIRDKTLLRLIRHYLEAGMMNEGIIEPRTEATPEGGPLLPLLSNILLDDLDKELERRGHRLEGYADDCNIYVRSKAAGMRVLASVTRFAGKKLKLQVNAAKSGVDRPWKGKFLGYSMTSHRRPRLKAAGHSVARLKDKVRSLWRAGRGGNLGRFIREDLNRVLRGWAGYYRLAEARGIFEELDAWVRRKLRCSQWRQWKRGQTRRKELVKLGLEPERAIASAFNGRGSWWNAGASHMNEALPAQWFRQHELVFMLEVILRWQRQASP